MTTIPLMLEPAVSTAPLPLPSPPAGTSPCRARVATLQIGMGWFPDQPGGLNRYFLELLRHLPGAGARARGLVCASERVAEETNGSVSAFAAPATSLIRRWRRIRQCVERELAGRRHDVVVSHFALYARPALRAIRQRPLVVHFHGPWAAEGRAEGAGRLAQGIKRRVERPVYGAADRIIVLSRAFGEILCREYGVSEERLRIVPGGVDTARFDVCETRSQARRLLGWPTDRPIVLAVRRLASRMGLEDLIDATKVVRARRPDALLMIAGAGRLTRELQARIEARGIREGVRLLGFLPDDDLPLAYRAADLTVVPSVALEGFGLSAAESLAAGTPVVVTPVGGLPEVVQGLSADLVLARPGPRELAEVVSALLARQVKVPSARACREHARRQFDWSVVARRVRGVYEEVVRA